MDATLDRRLAAEALGTALLVVFGPGSLVAALRLGDGELDHAGLGMVALSFGLVVALVVYASNDGPGDDPQGAAGDVVGPRPERRTE